MENDKNRVLGRNEDHRFNPKMKCNNSSECSRNEMQGVEPKCNTAKRTGVDARSYREWLKSSLTKSNLSGKRNKLSQGGGIVSGANASMEVEKEVAKSSSKRQRVDFDSNGVYNIELGHDLHSISLPVTFCDDIILKGGRKSMARPSMELAKECPEDLRCMESHLEDKTDTEHITCVICMLGGKLLCCNGKGCKRRYHISCLDPPLNCVPPGVWHCIWCVIKKIELGVYSVSEAAESIWDARKGVSDDEVLVMQRQKQYLVKYRGLAHVHNCWVPETQLLLEAPKLVAKFNMKSQVIKWKAEWNIPQRLIQKRMLLFPKHQDKFFHAHDDNNSDCRYEWLVKWTGLGYEHATWELDTASFLTSPEAMKLISDYESRHENGRRLSSPCKADELGKATFHELSELSFGGSSGEHNHHLSFVNKLRKHWRKGQNAMVVDEHADQERIVKVILFILSLQLDVLRPFLIISTSTALSVWEAEFSHLAPCANIVVYKGNKDVRSSIRSLEFFNGGGGIMFNVLVSSADVVVEDLLALECIRWEAIIIDECQRSKVSKHFLQIKMLAADMRLLLVTGQIKDCLGDYHNLLSLLDPGYDGLNSDNMEIDSYTNISKLKERVAQYIASECKSGSSRFVEYWVPVQLSNVQLEQYCATLLSNSMFLCSCLKNEPADALRNIIISARKCCDHPYLLDQSLQSFVTKGLPVEEYLDVEIRVSGKLQVLDKILLEIRDRGLRVLILFQSIGVSGRDSVGDILDDFVHQRFGKDSYIRFDGRGYACSKKKAALNMFNDKENGKFVFLIENRACLPSIKLSSVDAIILFDSDWDPENDLKALHRISISSQFEQLKVFRLYSSCTLEEKILILAKEGMALDSNIHSINPDTCHTLLNWGASYLFNKLDNFHGCNSSDSGTNISSEQSPLNDVLRELSTQLPHSGDSDDESNCSIILKVQQGEGYARNLLLLGEREMQFMNSEPPIFFWTNLLEGRNPQWKFLSGSSQRIRKKVLYLNNSPEKSEFENVAAIKKRRKVSNNTVDTTYLKSRLKGQRKVIAAKTAGKVADNTDDLNQVSDSLAMPPVANKIARVCDIDIIESGEQNKRLGVWKSTQFLPKPEISELCEILQLPENVKDIAVRFLKYIRKEFNVSWEAISTSQAFQISLCWVAASLSKHSIDHKESIAFAKLHLNYDCKEDEADYIYSKLRKMKKKFARRLEKVKGVKESYSSKASKSSTSEQQNLVNKEIQRGFDSHDFPDLLESARDEQAPDRRIAHKNHFSKQVWGTCDGRMEELKQNQLKEVQEFNKMMEEKAKLEEEHRLESALICSRDSDMSVRLNKPRMLDLSFMEKMDEHNSQLEIHRKKLEDMQLISRIEEEQLKTDVEMKLGRPIALSGSLSSTDLDFKVDKMQPSKVVEINDGSENAISKAMPSLQNWNHSGSKPSVPSEVPQSSHIEKISSSFPMGMEIISIESDAEINEMEAMALKRATTTCAKQLNKASSSIDSPKNGASVFGPSELENPIGNIQITQSVGNPFEVPQTLPSEAVMGDDPMEMFTHAVQPNEECIGTDPVTLESTTITQVRQQDGAVTTICGESPALEFNGTSSSLMQPDICSAQGNLLASHQLLMSTNSSSTNIPVSMGMQQSSGSHANSQEALIPRQPPLENHVELFGMPESGSEHVPDWSRTTLPGPVHYHPQAVPVIPEMPYPTYLDPLQIEMERIQNHKEQAIKIHEDTVLQLKSKCDKEIKEILKKYGMLLQDAETALVQKQKDLETNHYKVYLNKLLADAFTLKQGNFNATGSLHTEQGLSSTYMDQLVELACQQANQTTAQSLEQYLVSSPMNVPLVVPAEEVVNYSPVVLSASPDRPHSSPAIQFPGNFHNGGELRAPAPHLRAFRASPSMQTAHVSTPCSAMPNLQSLSNPLATSVMLTMQHQRSLNM